MHGQLNIHCGTFIESLMVSRDMNRANRVTRTLGRRILNKKKDSTDFDDHPQNAAPRLSERINVATIECDFRI